MTELLVRWHLLLARHRPLVVLLVVLFAIGALWSGRRLKLNEDFTDMLPMSDPAIAEQVQALQHIRQAERLFVDIQTSELDPERLASAADRMSGELRNISGLGEFRYLIEADDMQALFEQLQAQLPTLLSFKELHDIAGKLELPALEKRLAWMKNAMSQPQGLMLKQIVQTDPVGLGDAVSERLRLLQTGVGDARLVAGRITSADGRHVLISAVPAFRPSDPQPSAVLVAQVLNAARRVESDFPTGTVQIAVTGAHRVALENATMIRKDTTLTSVIATVTVAGLMFAAYRRRWLAVLGLAPTVFGAMGALLMFYLSGDPVSAVALGCGSILIGVTVDYGIYVLYHTDDAPPTTREQLARAVAQLTPTLAFGALTTMAAFLVMFVSPISGHRQLGLFGLVGVALAALFAMAILPLFIPLGAAGAGRVLPLTAVMQRLFAWRDRRAKVVLPLLLLFSGLCVAGVLRLRFEGDFARLNGLSPEARRDEAVVRQVWGKALSLTTVVVLGNSREEALRKNEQVYAVLRSLQQQGKIESFSSVAPLVPSEQTRQANLRDWSAFWSEDRRQALSNSLAGAAAKLGYRFATFTPFLERLATQTVPAGTRLRGASARPAPELPVAEPVLNRILNDYWSEKEGGVAVCTLVKVGEDERFRLLRQALQKETPGTLLLNKTALSDEITRVARRSLPVFAAMVVALNGALLFLYLGRLSLVLITLLPLAAGMFWTLGTLGLLGQPIDMANFIFAIFVIGVGGDYSLFMLMAELEPLRGHTERTAATGGAVSICAGTTLLGVGVLVLAKHPAMFSIGLSAWLGISLTLLATLFLLPPCVGRLRRQATRSSAYSRPDRPNDASSRRKQVCQLYRYQGPHVEQYAYWKLRTDPLFRALDTVAPRQGHFLDVGCGYGLVMHWLALDAPQRTLHGMDHDRVKIRVARAAAAGSSRVSFEEGDLQVTAWPACDALLLCDVLHYFPRDLKEQILRLAFEALRPNGILIVRDACRDISNHRFVAWSERFAVWSRHNKTVCGLHFEDAASYRSLLGAAGFADVRAIPDAGLGSNVMLTATRPAKAGIPNPAA